MTMKKDKKIQGFMAANKPQVSDSGQFMESLKEQMDLLPTPATMTEQENIDGQEWLAKLRAGMKASFRRDVLWVCGASLAMLCVAVVAYFLLFANTGITANTETATTEFNAVTITEAPIDTVTSLTSITETGNNLTTSLSSFSHLPFFYIIFGLVLSAITLLICIPILSRDDVL